MNNGNPLEDEKMLPTQRYEPRCELLLLLLARQTSSARHAVCPTGNCGAGIT
jgi:hypothetical protein